MFLSSPHKLFLCLNFTIFLFLIKSAPIRHNIGTFLLFPRKSISAILCTVKKFVTQPFRKGRLFCCKGGGYHFSKQNPQALKGWSGRSQLFQHSGFHLHCGIAVGFYHRPVFNYHYKTGAGPLCRPDGKTNSAFRRTQFRNRRSVWFPLLADWGGGQHLLFHRRLL